MSDLAPFVAAALRDQVVKDLQEEVIASKRENERLERALSPWTVTITLPSGTVVARGQLSMRRAFAQTVRMDPNIQTVEVDFEMLNGTTESCSLDNFFESTIALEVTTPETETSIVVCTKLLGDPNWDTGYEIAAHEGRFQIGWTLVGTDCVFDYLFFDLPIPESEFEEFDEAAVEGRESTIPFARDVVGNQAPICFRFMSLKVQKLRDYLNQH